jgi:hypothetical protein
MIGFQSRHSGAPKIVVEYQEVCIALLVGGFIVKSRVERIHSEGSPKLVVVAWRDVRVERNMSLYGLLNEDVGNFFVLNFGNKSHIFCAFIALLLKLLFILFLSYGFISFL